MTRGAAPPPARGPAKRDRPAKPQAPTGPAKPSRPHPPGDVAPGRLGRQAAWKPRRASARDLPAILALERLCFEPHRLASPRSLRRSLQSRRQSVWVLDDGALEPPLAGLLVLWHFPRMVRVYDVATHPDRRGAGIGHLLMRHAEALARRDGCDAVQLEADPTTPGLVGWYERQGYPVVARLQDFYAEGKDAVRMRKELGSAPKRRPAGARTGKAR